MKWFVVIYLSASVSSGLAAGGFYTAAELPVKPRNLQQAVKAVAYLRTVVGEESSHCSSVVISEEGHVATGIHCLRLCLDKIWGLYDPQIRQRAIERFSFYSGTVIDEPVPTQLQCPPYAMWTMELESRGLKNPKVVWIGRGRQTHDAEKIPLISEDEYQTLRELTEDVVILKYEKTNPAPAACIPLSTKNLKPGDPVWLAGYAGKTARGSEDKRLSWSHGVVRASVLDDPIYKQAAMKLAPEFRETFWWREAGMWDRSHLLATDVDGYGGSSGGALINDNGEAEAIAFSMTKTSPTAYEGATLHGVKLQFVKEKIRQSLGDAAAEAVFHCQSSEEYR